MLKENQIALCDKLVDAKIECQLTESFGGTIRIRNKALLLDKETGNGRIYPSEVVKKAIQEAASAFKSHELLCTVDGHPTTVFPEPDNASHYVVDSWIEDGYLWAESIVMGDTKKGKTLLGLIKNGASIGISVRGVGSVNGDRVSDYTYYGFDFVGEPSTGLRQRPDVIEDDSIRESQSTKSINADKSIVYIKENNSDEQYKTRNHKNMLHSYDAFRKVLEESKSFVSTSKTLTEKQSRISLAESKLANYMNNVDVATAPFGGVSITESYNEWRTFVESSVTNSSDNVSPTMFEPSVGGNPEPIENKNSMQMKDATKESEDTQKLQDELVEAKSIIKNLTKSNINIQKNSLRESNKLIAMRTMGKMQQRKITESNKIIKQSHSLVNESVVKINSLVSERNKLRESLITTRKQALALSTGLKTKSSKGVGSIVESKVEMSRVKKLKEELESMQKYAKELEKESDHNLGMAEKATDLLVANEMALREACETIISLRKQLNNK